MPGMGFRRGFGRGRRGMKRGRGHCWGQKMLQGRGRGQNRGWQVGQNWGPIN